MSLKQLNFSDDKEFSALASNYALLRKDYVENGRNAVKELISLFSKEDNYIKQFDECASNSTNDAPDIGVLNNYFEEKISDLISLRRRTFRRMKEVAFKMYRYKKNKNIDMLIGERVRMAKKARKTDETEDASKVEEVRQTDETKEAPKVEEVHKADIMEVHTLPGIGKITMRSGGT